MGANCSCLSNKIFYSDIKILEHSKIQNNFIITNNISKYLTDKFLNDNKGLLTQDVYLINEFRNRIKQKFLLRNNIKTFYFFAMGV